MPSDVRSGRSGFAYVPALDGLRAVAVFFVILRHSTWSTTPGGWIGVDIFFVLSGFLITSILLAEQRREGTINLTRFWLNRALRLVPCLYFFLLVWALVCLYRGTLGENIASIIMGALYVINHSSTIGYPTGSVPHLWSLGVEEQFYIVWPLLLLVVIWRLPSRARVPLILAMCVAVALWRAWNTSDPIQASWNYISLTRRADTLLLGCALAFVLDRKDETAATLGRVSQFFAWPAVAILVGLLFYIQPWERMHQIFLYPVVEVSAATVICALASNQKSILSRILAFPPLSYVGQISYGMYVWLFVVLYEMWFLTGDPVKQMLWGTLALIVIASASYWIIERPFLKLKDRSRAAAVLTNTVPDAQYAQS